MLPGINVPIVVVAELQLAKAEAEEYGEVCQLNWRWPFFGLTLSL